MITADQVRADFDELADLVDDGESGTDRYDAYLASLVPSSARSILDVGCGLGRLTRAIAMPDREVAGVDLSPRMIERAQAGRAAGTSFVQGEFLEMDFGSRRFDCVVSAAALHHMPADLALRKMNGLLTPAGRLIVHDLRRDASPGDVVRAYAALAGVMAMRLIRTGRPRPRKRARQAWDRHGAREEYLSLEEARALANRALPGAAVHYQWMWRYTLVWDKPSRPLRHNAVHAQSAD